MKVKSAIAVIKQSEGDLYQLVGVMYRNEANARIHAGHGKDIVATTADEMARWITAVAHGVGLSKEHTETLINLQRGQLFAKHGIVDPRVTKQIEEMQREVGWGRPAGGALTRKGLEAMTAMMLGRIGASASELGAASLEVMNSKKEEEDGD